MKLRVFFKPSGSPVDFDNVIRFYVDSAHLLIIETLDNGTYTYSPKDWDSFVFNPLI